MTRTLRLALIMTACAATLSACASTRKTPVSPEGPAPSQPYAPPAGNGGGQQSGILPGSEQDFIINVGDHVYFDFDSYAVRADAAPVLAAQAAWLSRNPAVRIRIEGNCDERGTREYNLALGARRANAVRDFLVARGVSGQRIATLSYGKERPMDGGGSDDAQARNRNARTAIVDGAR